jgi:hypothetical protein
LIVFFVRFRIGVPVIIYSEDSALGGLDPIALETLIRFLRAPPLTYGVGLDLSRSNYFLFLLLSTRNSACPKENASRVLVLGLRARFGTESPPSDSPAWCLDRRVVGIWNLIIIYSQIKKKCYY